MYASIVHFRVQPAHRFQQNLVESGVTLGTDLSYLTQAGPGPIYLTTVMAPFNVEQALPAYQASRQPVLEKLTQAALTSALWYESFGEHMAMEPAEFCKSYILRSQRLGAETVRKMSPKFVETLAENAVEV